jgi:hypothetical protein
VRRYTNYSGAAEIKSDNGASFEKAAFADVLVPITDMCMYIHTIVGVSIHDYGRAMAGYICPTHTVSVTYKLGVTTAG